MERTGEEMGTAWRRRAMRRRGRGGGGGVEGGIPSSGGIWQREPPLTSILRRRGTNDSRPSVTLAVGAKGDARGG